MPRDGDLFIYPQETKATTTRVNLVVFVMFNFFPLAGSTQLYACFAVVSTFFLIFLLGIRGLEAQIHFSKNISYFPWIIWETSGYFYLQKFNIPCAYPTKGIWKHFQRYYHSNINKLSMRWWGSKSCQLFVRNCKLLLRWFSLMDYNINIYWWVIVDWSFLFLCAGQ